MINLAKYSWKNVIRMNIVEVEEKEERKNSHTIVGTDQYFLFT